MQHVIVFNKPYGVLSQFSDENGHPGLSNYIEQPNFYAAGRLDRDSEGCLVLTDDGQLQQFLSSPRHNKSKTYWAQVEGIPDEAALNRIRKGVELNDGPARPASCRKMDAPNPLWPRNPPIRFRKNVPDSWLELTLSEGRNRQVRRMTAAIGHPTLRLIRWSVDCFDINGLQPGEWRFSELPKGYFKRREARPNQTGAGNRERSFRGSVKRLGK